MDMQMDHVGSRGSLTRWVSVVASQGPLRVSYAYALTPDSDSTECGLERRESVLECVRMLVQDSGYGLSVARGAVKRPAARRPFAFLFLF